MNLREQQYVCTLARTNSITLAAKELFISQPALSSYINNLEKSLGVKLFERIGKRFVLTYAGELYVERAKKMLELKESFDIELLSIVNGYRERLRVGMQDIRSSMFSPVLIPEFTNKFPNVDLIWYEEIYERLEERLLNNQVDLFFCNCPYFKKNLEYIAIAQDEILFLVHKDNPLIEQCAVEDETTLTYPWIDLNKFVNERFLLFYEGQSLRSYTDQIFAECNFKPKNIFLLRRTNTIIQLINKGFGVGFCQKSYLKSISQTENIRMFTVGQSIRNTIFSAIYIKGRELPHYAFTLIDMLKNIM